MSSPSPIAHPTAPGLRDPRVRPLSLAAERALPVGEAFAGLLPAGLPRGATVRVAGPAGPSTALGLLATASRQGSWVAVAGWPDPGWQAAAELGLELARVVVVDPIPADAWASVAAALLDGFDAVVLGPAHRTPPSVARRLAARARERGTVLVSLVGDRPGAVGPGPGDDGWGAVADLAARAAVERWDGIEVGFGRLARRVVQVELEGRRVPGRHRRGRLWLPGPTGAPEVVLPEVATLAAAEGRAT